MKPSVIIKNGICNYHIVGANFSDPCERYAAAETEEIRKRIEYEYLSIDFLKTVRIEDDALRARETDRFAEKVRAAGITEIMERIHLELSFEMMKDNRYASDRSKGYRMYYIIR